MKKEIIISHNFRKQIFYTSIFSFIFINLYMLETYGITSILLDSKDILLFFEIFFSFALYDLFSKISKRKRNKYSSFLLGALLGGGYFFSHNTAFGNCSFLHGLSSLSLLILLVTKFHLKSYKNKVE